MAKSMLEEYRWARKEGIEPKNDISHSKLLEMTNRFRDGARCLLCEFVSKDSQYGKHDNCIGNHILEVHGEEFIFEILKDD